MQKKSGNFLLTLKSLDETGSFEGYASVFNVIDTQGEEVVRGAFQKSLEFWSRSGRMPKMLWQHDTRRPIGVWEHIQEDDQGLYVKGRLLLDIKAGQEAYNLLKAGVVDGLSIGFVTRRSRQSPHKQCRLLEQVDLHEISLVTFAANPEARVTRFKVDDEEELLFLMRRLDKLSEFLQGRCIAT